MSSIADLYTNAAGFRLAMREACGYPGNSTVLLPDSTVDNARDRAFSKLLRDFGEPTIASFATVDGQQTYTPIAGIADAMAIKRVFWPAPVGACLTDYRRIDDLLFGLTVVVDESGTRILRDPGQLALVQGNMRQLEILAADGAMIIDNKTVYLDPLPSTTGDNVWFVYTAERWTTYLTVDAFGTEPYQRLVEAYLHQRLSVGAAAPFHVEDEEEGTGYRTHAPKHHLESAKMAMRMYNQTRPAIRRLWP